MTRIGIILFDGFDALDAIGPWEAFRKARRGGAPIDAVLLAAERTSPVVSSDGLQVTGFEPLESAEVDWLLVPGGDWVRRGPTGAWAEIQRGDLPALLRSRREAGTPMASVCTGAMILSAAGITRGREVTTHTVARSALRDEGATVIDARVVDDGDLVTSAGVTAGIDLALWMIERLVSKEASTSVARTLEWHHDTEVHRGARSTVAR